MAILLINMYKSLRYRSTKKHWRIFRYTIRKAYTKLSSKGKDVYIFNSQE